MGSIVEYRCPSCAFATGELSIGWGKAGRASFWGGLARCEPCKTVGVVDLSRKGVGYGDRKCQDCGRGLVVLEGTFVSVTCPRCSVPMNHATLGTWQ